MIPSGNTLVMGGLISDETLNGNTKVPVLGDLPGLGMMFRHDSKERNRQSLIVFITPTIVQDTDFQNTKTDFLKQRIPKDPDTTESAWDSGHPLDWTKPAGDAKVAVPSFE